MSRFSKYALPAEAVADVLNEKLRGSQAVVVTAPPGAGKSTLLPLTIMDGLTGTSSPGRILMLEPRRIAARQIAERMADMLGEKPGGTVGYRVRFESRVSRNTRIEVLTEGILTRMLVEDPTLDGVSVVIFDEFHERSLASDMALALVRESCKLVRPDLKIVIMSATIDAAAICAALDAPLVESGGRMYPVDLVRMQTDPDMKSLAQTVAHQIRLAHRDEEGDILAFLPGEGEIRRCAELLGNSLGATRICPLYGMLPFEEQRRAIAPSPAGERKVVLATPVAETSLTIEGVRIVVDSGYCRRMVFNPQNGLSRLETVRISMDMADQRSGRAGRVAPGKCYRMWSLASEKRMAATRDPEILEADLAPAVLEAAAWGSSDMTELQWLTPPPASHVASGMELLRSLGAIDDTGNISEHGRALEKLSCHPRIARMLIEAGTDRLKALAADIAAILEEKDPLSLEEDGASLAARVEALRTARARKSGNAGLGRIRNVSAQYRSMVDVAEDNSEADPFAVGALLARAYPERIARADKDGCGRFQLAGGGMACVDRADPLAACPWIAVAGMNSQRDGAGRIFMAAPLDVADITEMLQERDNISWDSRNGAVVARRESRIGMLLVDSRPIHDVARTQLDSVICDAARKEGESMLDFNESVGNLQRRVATVAAWHPELELPDISTAAVLSRAGEWLPMFIGKATTVTELKRIDLETAFWSLLDYGQQQAVERLAPSHITVPTGSRIRVEYRQGADAPVLRVRLQECFGLVDTPTVNDGRIPVLMELLSPGFRPVQLTSDLRSFWTDTYFEVRKDLRRRYPKHSWPDDPLEAEAVRGVARKK